MSEIRYCANPDCRDEDGNRTVIDPGRVRRRPSIRACSGACKQAAHRRRKADDLDGAGDVTTGRRRHGQRGIDVPYRRAVRAVADYIHANVALSRHGAERVAAEILEPTLSPRNRERLTVLRGLADSRARAHVVPADIHQADPSPAGGGGRGAERLEDRRRCGGGTGRSAGEPLGLGPSVIEVEVRPSASVPCERAYPVREGDR